MDGIIFDVDGTLWDSTETVAESWNQAIRDASDMEPNIDGAILKTVFGKPMDEICDILLPGLPLKERTRVGELCFEYENQLLEQKPGILYKGVRETLAELTARTDLYIVSNCQCGYIETLLKTCKLEPYFKDFLCFGQTQLPKGRTIRLLMERNDLKDVVYVGDTQGDADACKDAGIPFIFAEYGFGDVPDANVRISKFSDLVTLFPSF